MIMSAAIRIRSTHDHAKGNASNMLNIQVTNLAGNSLGSVRIERQELQNLNYDCNEFHKFVLQKLDIPLSYREKIEIDDTNRHMLPDNVTENAGSYIVAISNTLVYENDKLDSKEKLKKLTASAPDTPVELKLVRSRSDRVHKAIPGPNKEKLQECVNNWIRGSNAKKKVEMEYGPIEEWNVSKIEDMKYLFNRQDSFDDDISLWDVSNVVNMEFMFFSAKSFNQPIGKWDVSNVKNMESMFYKAEKFNYPLDKWKVFNVNESMYLMFSGARDFKGPIWPWSIFKDNSKPLPDADKVRGMFFETDAFDNDDNVNDVLEWEKVLDEKTMQYIDLCPGDNLIDNRRRKGRIIQDLRDPESPPNKQTQAKEESKKADLYLKRKKEQMQSNLEGDNESSNQKHARKN